MKLSNRLIEELSKSDAKNQAKQLSQWLKKQKLEKGSKEEEKAIDKWLTSKDFSDKDADRILKFLK